jgi:hypothetical protein
LGIIDSLAGLPGQKKNKKGQIWQISSFKKDQIRLKKGQIKEKFSKKIYQINSYKF